MNPNFLRALIVIDVVVLMIYALADAGFTFSPPPNVNDYIRAHNSATRP